MLKACNRERQVAIDEKNLKKDRFALFNGKKIGIVGGHVKEIRKLEKALTDYAGVNEVKSKVKLTIKCTESGINEKADINKKVFYEKYQNSDLLIINVGYCGHSLSNLAKDLCCTHGIKFITINNISDLESIPYKCEILLQNKTNQFDKNDICIA